LSIYRKTFFTSNFNFSFIFSGYAYSQGMSESVLGVMMAVGALTGIMGTYGFQYFKRKVGLVRTGLFSLWGIVACLTLCVASIWVPGSPFDLYHNKTLENVNRTCTGLPRNTSLYSPILRPNSSLGLLTDDHRDSPDPSQPFGFQNSTAYNNTSLDSALDSGTGESGLEQRSDPCVGSTSRERNFFSLALLMTGIISARFGKHLGGL
jgi:hypothetical protein